MGLIHRVTVTLWLRWESSLVTPCSSFINPQISLNLSQEELKEPQSCPGHNSWPLITGDKERGCGKQAEHRHIPGSPHTWQGCGAALGNPSLRNSSKDTTRSHFGGKMLENKA